MYAVFFLHSGDNKATILKITETQEEANEEIRDWKTRMSTWDGNLVCNEYDEIVHFQGQGYNITVFIGPYLTQN